MNVNSGKNNLLSVLTLKNDRTGEKYDILKKITHMVTRAGFNGDIEISGDSSISRCHAEIFLIKEEVCGKINLHLKLVDKDSKFGTFVNAGINLNEKITPKSPVILKLGDQIRFGVYDSFWTVVKYSFVACPSTLKMADKEILKKSLKEIGGQVSRDWSKDCTHLCMNSVTVTEKVLLCLASAKLIIIPKYFTDLSKALSSNSLEKLPFCIDYKPILTEKLLNPNTVSMDVNNDRKNIFSGKTFICSSIEQLNRISKIVKTAGGDLKYYMDSIMCGDEYNFEMLQSNEYIVMQQCQHNAQNNQKYKLILDKLKMINKRPITENEIGLSIIYASTTKHCNPSFNFTLVNLQSQPDISNSQAPAILEPETAEILTVEDSQIFSVNVVPDSLTQSNVKRSLDIVMDSEEIVMSKKRTCMSNNSVKVKENSELFTNVISLSQSYNEVLSYFEGKGNLEPLTSVKSTPTCSNILSYNEAKENLEPLTSVESTPTCSNKMSYNEVNCKSSHVTKSPNDDSCLSKVQSSQDFSNKNLSSQVQFIRPFEVDKNVDNTLHNSSTKRKLQSFCLTSENEDEDPFNYMDIDETEEHIVKKSKSDITESIVVPMLSAMSDKTEQSKSVELHGNIAVVPNLNYVAVDSNPNIAVDPNFIMNLLATAKGTSPFIDTRTHSNKSSVSVNEDSKHDDLANSVITETVSMVVSRSITQGQSVQGIPHLKNFKKFKRKGPTIRIPNIVSLELGQD